MDNRAGESTSPLTGAAGRQKLPVLFDAEWAAHYDKSISEKIPDYFLFLEDMLRIAGKHVHHLQLWLDLGCGTGIVGCRVAERFPDARVLLADPSVPMLEVARAKASKMGLSNVTILGPYDSLGALRCMPRAPDVVSASLCHHLEPHDYRCAVMKLAYDRLLPGGVFITHEIVRAGSDEETEEKFALWESFQRAHGIDDRELAALRIRYFEEFHPQTVQVLEDSLCAAGFKASEVFRLLHLQAGIYGLKDF